MLWKVGRRVAGSSCEGNTSPVWMRIRSSEQSLESVLKGVKDMPLDILQLCNLLDIEVLVSDSHVRECSTNFSSQQSRAQVVVTTYVPHKVRRVLVACGIHHILNHPPGTWNFVGPDSPQKREAWKFAKDLLLPPEDFKRVFGLASPQKLAEELSEAFIVPKNLVYIRVGELNSGQL